MSDSTIGYGTWVPGRFWTLPCPPDTTPEAAAIQHQIWMSYTGEERLTIWLTRIEAMHELRRQQIRAEFPDADHAAVQRHLIARNYPGEFTDEYLDGYEAFVRAQHELEPAMSPAACSDSGPVHPRENAR